MTQQGREYGYSVSFEEHQLIGSVLLRSDIACDVEARVYRDNNKSMVKNYTAEVNSPQEAIVALGELSKEAVKVVAREPGVAEGIARKVQRKMEEYFFKNGVLCRDEHGNVLTATVLKNRISNEGNHTKVSNRGMLANMLKGQLRIPPFLGGLPIVDVRTYMEPSAFAIHVFHFLWGDAEDKIEAKIEVQSHEIETITVDMLQSKLDREVNTLRLMHPGDFEVVCIDATGQEHLFDEGSSYLAERHLDSEFIWVYDRYGQRNEYSASRFSKVPTEAKMMQPYIPGNTMKDSEPKRGLSDDPFGRNDDGVPQSLKRVFEKMNEELGR